jgi:hypothetical protein
VMQIVDLYFFSALQVFELQICFWFFFLCCSNKSLSENRKRVGRRHNSI